MLGRVNLLVFGIALALWVAATMFFGAMLHAVEMGSIDIAT
jgi:hypothetical protein